MGNRRKLLSFDYTKYISTPLHVAVLRKILANMPVDVSVVHRTTITTFSSTCHVFLLCQQNFIWELRLSLNASISKICRYFGISVHNVIFFRKNLAVCVISNLQPENFNVIFLVTESKSFLTEYLIIITCPWNLFQIYDFKLLSK